MQVISRPIPDSTTDHFLFKNYGLVLRHRSANINGIKDPGLMLVKF
jgi:hypothetical protein